MYVTQFHFCGQYPQAIGKSFSQETLRERVS